MKLLEALKWRYATKKFDSTKKISESDLEQIKEAVRLSASSYGLQLFKVLLIEDAELRGKLQAASWNQAQITDASQLFVFCNYTKVKPENIDEYIDLKAKTQGIDVNLLTDYADFMKNTIGGMPEEVQAIWTAKQTYIALGNLLAASAELGIDACPMEGFVAKQYNEILGLDEKGLNAAVIATVGYRSSEDETQGMPKVRKSSEDLFELL